MNLRVMTLTVLLPACLAWSAPVRVHLPREAVVSAPNVTLGDLAIIVCDDPALKKTLEALPMGRAPWTRETITINRAMLLSRLATCGVGADQVVLSGAQQVAVRKPERVFPAAEVSKVAMGFLKTLPGQEASRWHAVRKGGDLSAPGGLDLQLRAQLAGAITEESVTVRVVATDGETEHARVELTFRRSYALRRAVAVKDIRPGEALTVENVKVEETEVDRAPATTWLPSPTAVATAPIAKGTAIRPDQLEGPKVATAVKRGQVVVMRLAGDGFTVSTLAEVMQDGAAGQVIKVRNVDTKRIVAGTVMPDGTVQPRYDEVNP